MAFYVSPLPFSCVNRIPMQRREDLFCVSIKRRIFTRVRLGIKSRTPVINIMPVLVEAKTK